MPESHGGDRIAEVLDRWSITSLFTLCGGHISPLLVGAQARGIRIVDGRDERSMVFAADAAARLSGRPGVVAVTAGPGVTNAVTALKNAQMAQSPVVVFGGATATMLEGRGALQDIDQAALVRSTVKRGFRCRRVPELGPTTERALEEASSGVPGPVFVEVPVDLLYPEATVRSWYLEQTGAAKPTSLATRALRVYLEGYLWRQFHQPPVPAWARSRADTVPEPTDDDVRRVADRLASAHRPVLVIGSQTLVGERDPASLAAAVESLGVPTWLGGMARGLLGRSSEVQFRHRRSRALKEADLVLVAGFPLDFRMGYGRGFGRATLAAVNRSRRELELNRKPDIAVHASPATFLRALAGVASPSALRTAWFEQLRGLEAERDAEIAAQAAPAEDKVNPIQFLLRLEEALQDDAILVADGGDFVGSAAYTLRPRGPLAWLDPGAFGTLGVGGGFAAGAAAVHPDRPVWILYGDGSCAYSIAEFDTFVRQGMAPIAVVGNDASWQQIARDQVTILGDDVGTRLRATAYHRVAEGYGGVGLEIADAAAIDPTLEEAKHHAAAGRPVLINVHLAPTEFRKGSISI
jgi:acetolactate synthase-1/2/3 large subunit